MTIRSGALRVKITWTPPEDEVVRTNLEQQVRAHLMKLNLARYYCHFKLVDKTARLDIDFNLSSRMGYWEEIPKDYVPNNYNQLIEDLHILSNLVDDIPEKFDPVGQYSTRDYKAPWVQIYDLHENTFAVLLRDGATRITIELTERMLLRSTDLTTIKSICVVGEPHVVKKIKRTIALGIRSSWTLEQIASVIAYTQNNPHWLIAANDNSNNRQVYSNVLFTHTPVNPAIAATTDRLIINLTPSLPKRGRIGKNLSVHVFE